MARTSSNIQRRCYYVNVREEITFPFCLHLRRALVLLAKLLPTRGLLCNEITAELLVERFFLHLEDYPKTFPLGGFCFLRKCIFALSSNTVHS